MNQLWHAFPVVAQCVLSSGTVPDMACVLRFHAWHASWNLGRASYLHGSVHTFSERPSATSQRFRGFLTVLPSLPHTLGPPAEPPGDTVNAAVKTVLERPRIVLNAIFAI